LQSITGRQVVAYRHIILLSLYLQKFSKKWPLKSPKICNRRQPHSHFRPPPRGTPSNVRMHVIFSQTRVIGLHFCRCTYGSIFIQICAVGSKRRIFPATECVLAVQGRSRSSNSKVDDFGTNRKRIYGFLLVGHCDYGRILHRF